MSDVTYHSFSLFKGRPLRRTLNAQHRAKLREERHNALINALREGAPPPLRAVISESGSWVLSGPHPVLVVSNGETWEDYKATKVQLLKAKDLLAELGVDVPDS